MITSSSSSSSSDCSSSEEDLESRLVNEEEDDVPLPPARSLRDISPARERASRKVDTEFPAVIVLRVYT
jgi:hypothetical protein